MLAAVMAKPLLGVVHLPPLLSSARGGQPFEKVLAHALRDAAALHAGGVDGIFVENFGDAPFHKGTAADPVPPDVPAALAVAAREIRRATGLPVGVNCLRNDGVAAVAAAAVAGATWVRINVFTGACLTDQGVIDGEAARVLAWRKQLGSCVQIAADVFVKHAVPLAPLDVATTARDLAERSGAAVMIVSGRRTGEAVDAAFLRAVKLAVGSFPVWLGSGLGSECAADLWPHCDGAIVGTAFKRGGIVTNPVDPRRVARLVSQLASFR